VLKLPLSGIDLRAWRSLEAAAALGYDHTRKAIAEGQLKQWRSDADDISTFLSDENMMSRVTGRPS